MIINIPEHPVITNNIPLKFFLYPNDSYVMIFHTKQTEDGTHMFIREIDENIVIKLLVRQDAEELFQLTDGTGIDRLPISRSAFKSRGNSRRV